MSYLPRALPAVIASPRREPGEGAAGWPDLAEELDRWRDAGRVARLWWRDDDAVAASPQLAALLRLAGGTPLALAVIPALAEPGLAAAIAAAPGVAVLQHGWRHANHQAGDGKNCEYPAGRSPAEVAAELRAGKARLAALFGPRALPVLVPPWNRFAAEFLPLLLQAGFATLSAGGTSPDPASAGVARVDVHVDPVAWRGDRGFVGEPAVLAALLAQLRARRLGAAPAGQAVGLLTHHLVMDRPIAAFVERLIAVIGAHPAARWAGIAELLR